MAVRGWRSKGGSGRFWRFSGEAVTAVGGQEPLPTVMIAASRILTERLIIRPFEAADVEPLVRLFADPLVHRFVGDGLPLPIDQAELWVERSRENLDRHGYGTGAVVERATGAMIGWAGFARPGDRSEEIIYGLAQDRWGRGHGREILDALLAVAEARGIAPVRATVDPANHASIRLLERAGFRLIERAHRGDVDSDLYGFDRVDTPPQRS